jgi:NADPH:quinone reductase
MRCLRARRGQSPRQRLALPSAPLYLGNDAFSVRGAMAMSAKMVAVGYAASLPIMEDRSLFEFETPVPQPGDRDLLVRVQAISVNPVDVKSRMRRQGTQAQPLILGWDAAGIVEVAGRGCSLFKPGDHVYYAGNINRPGTNAPFHVVDERIVGHKPKSLSFAEAAALPLTTLTAWELMFDRIGVKRGEGVDRRSLLVVGGAGGVGSIAIQLARKLTGLSVITTASRPQTQEWVKGLGAQHVIDHTKPFAPQLKVAGFPSVDIVLSLTGTARNASQITEVLAPQGRLGVIEGADSLKAFDTAPLWSKCVSLHPELMFTRSTFGTADMIEQHRLLSEVAGLVDRGVLRTTMTANFGALNTANLKRAHAQLESGTTIGKIVLEVK